MSSPYLSLIGGKISKYDKIIKKNAEKIHWDWRLLASLIYQESRFEAHEKSWAGAIGLMQLLPRTAKQFDVKSIYNPEDNIKGGVNFLNWLQEYWHDIPDSLERIKFILASYNAGQGHVEDAQNLAEKYGKDPLLWEDNTAYYLLMKTHSKYYNDPVVKYGYCRGEEPINYVKEIIDRYHKYKLVISQ
jgi:membrane-bound lytic murein transglycosylase F